MECQKFMYSYYDFNVENLVKVEKNDYGKQMNMANMKTDCQHLFRKYL